MTNSALYVLTDTRMERVTQIAMPPPCSHTPLIDLSGSMGKTPGLGNLVLCVQAAVRGPEPSNTFVFDYMKGEGT